jgi:hypothetical protein
MAAYLNMPDQVIRQRIEHAMQGLLRAQALQIEAFAQRYTDIFDGEIARFAWAHERTHPITTDVVTVQWLNEMALQGLRDTANDNMLGLRERAAAQAEEAMDNDPAYDASRARQAQQDGAISEAIARMEHPPWLDSLPTEAEQRAYEDAPYDRREALAHGDTGERDGWLEIDTSDQDMGASWQQTLEHLQARLEALARAFPDQHVAQGHTREEGMGY